mgnify:CR=1 FL=1
MKQINLFLLIFFSLFLVCCSNPNKELPNVIYILADDLGYGDVGFNGQKLIETPNIDYLASKGMIFSNHYSGAGVVLQLVQFLLLEYIQEKTTLEIIVNGLKGEMYGALKRCLMIQV